MGVIKEYSQQVATPGPQKFAEVSSDAYGGAMAKATAQLGTAVLSGTEVVAKAIEQKEIGDLNAKVAKSQNDLALELDTINKTTAPGDTKPFEDYQKKVSDTFADLSSEVRTAGGRAYFDEASEKVRGHMQLKAVEGQSYSVGLKAVQNYTESKNSLATSTTSDPSSLALSLDLHNQGLDALVKSGQLPADEAFKLKAKGETDLTKAAVRGWINLDPEYAKQKLGTGEFSKVFNEDVQHQMLGEADQAIRGKEIEAERQRREQERLQKQQQEQTQNVFLKKMTEGSLGTKDILGSNLEAFGSGSKEQFLQLMKTRNENDKIKTDPAVLLATFDRIHADDGDPRKITDENELNDLFINKKVSWDDLKNLRGEIAGKGTEQGKIESDLKKQFFNVAKSQLVKSNAMGLKDPAGEENFARFQAAAFDAIKQGRKDGKSMYALLTPGSKDYVGDIVQNFKKDSRQIMQETIKAMKFQAPLTRESVTPTPLQIETPTTPVQPPEGETQTAGRSGVPSRPSASSSQTIGRKPGESPKDYLRRIKGG